MALCVGVLALAPPPIVGAMSSVPSWGKDLVAAVAFVAAAWQIVGIAAVISDQPTLYRIYIRLNFIATLIILIITIAFTITAAALHQHAVDSCMETYEGSLAQDGMGLQAVEDTLSTVRHKLCDILSWVDVGMMGGLIILLGLTQLFMCYMQRRYGQRQRAAIANAKSGLGQDIPMTHRPQVGWGPRGRSQYAPLDASTAHRPTNVGPNGEAFYETYHR